MWSRLSSEQATEGKEVVFRDCFGIVSGLIDDGAQWCAASSKGFMLCHIYTRGWEEEGAATTEEGMRMYNDRRLCSQYIIHYLYYCCHYDCFQFDHYNQQATTHQIVGRRNTARVQDFMISL